MVSIMCKCELFLFYDNPQYYPRNIVGTEKMLAEWRNFLKVRPGVVAHFCNLSSWKAEAERLLQVWG